MTAQHDTGRSIPTAGGKLPVMGHAYAFGRHPLKFVQSLRSAGDLVKIQLGTTPVYVVNSPELLHQVLVTNGRNYCKGRLIDKARDALGNGLPVSAGDFHDRQRRMMQPAFHRERLTRYADVMCELADAEARSWKPGQVIDVPEKMFDLIFRIVVAAMFTADTEDHVRTTIEESLPIVLHSIAGRTLAPTDLLEKLPTRGNRRYRRARQTLRDAVSDIISAYRASGKDHGDLLSILAMGQDPKTGVQMSDNEIRDEVLLTIVAGTESSALTLSWLFYELGRHPDIQNRVRAEIDAAIPNRLVGYSDLPNLQYTRNALTETLRLHCPIWILMRRANTTVELGGHLLASGTELLLSPYALHRDPQLYPDPLRFDPDRWANDGPGLGPGSFIPFAMGKRQCLGNTFAWTQMSITAASVLARWSLRPLPGQQVREVVRAMVAPGNQLMQATPRQ